MWTDEHVWNDPCTSGRASVKHQALDCVILSRDARTSGEQQNSHVSSAPSRLPSNNPLSTTRCLAIPGLREPEGGHSDSQSTHGPKGKAVCWGNERCITGEIFLIGFILCLLYYLYYTNGINGNVSYMLAVKWVLD